MKKLNVFFTALAISLTLTLLASTRPASAQIINQICSSLISYAGRQVQGCKDNYTLSGNVYWKGKMLTKVTTGSAITKIGWNYWSDRRLCGGIPVVLYNMGASYSSSATKSWQSTSASHPVGSCAGGLLNQASVYGTHYWEQSGYSPITNTWTYNRTLP